MNEKIFQNIFDEIEQYLPQNWNKLIIYLEYLEEAYSFSFFVKKDSEYIKCYDLPEMNEDDLMKSFNNIDKVVDKERKTAKEIWTNMTMIVLSDGKMHTDFDYTDLLTDGYRYKKNWKAKYLT